MPINLVYSIPPLLRLTTSATLLSPAVAQKPINHPHCQSIAAFTLVLSKKPFVDLWTAFEMASRQKNSFRKVSW